MEVLNCLTEIFDAFHVLFDVWHKKNVWKRTMRPPWNQIHVKWVSVTVLLYSRIEFQLSIREVCARMSLNKNPQIDQKKTDVDKF